MFLFHVFVRCCWKQHRLFCVVSIVWLFLSCMKDVRKETEVPCLFHLCIIYIYSRRGDAEQDKSSQNLALKLSALSVLYEKLGMSFVVLWAGEDNWGSWGAACRQHCFWWISYYLLPGWKVDRKQWGLLCPVSALPINPCVCKHGGCELQWFMLVCVSCNPKWMLLNGIFWDWNYVYYWAELSPFYAKYKNSVCIWSISWD